MVEAHPDVVAFRKAAGRRSLLVHVPLMGAATVFVIVSGTIGAWWRQIGILVGLEGIIATGFHFMLWTWRAEKSLRLRVMLPCVVCGERVLASELLDHMRTLHPMIGRDASRSLWAANALFYGLTGYALILPAILLLRIFGDATWEPLALVGYIVLPSAAVVLYLSVFLALNRLHLPRAQREWEATHPQAPP